MSERAMEFGPVIEAHLDYVRDVMRLVPKSLVDKRCTFRKAIRIFADIRPGVELWKASLDDYLTLVEELRRSGTTVRAIAKDLSHLRGLIDYAWRGGRTDRNVLDGFQLQDLSVANATPPRVLSIKEADRLVRACPKATPGQRIERLMILLLYGCGLRTGELMGLDARHVDRDRKEIWVEKGKGGIQRRIPVPDGVWVELLAYLAERGRRKGALFRTYHKKTRLTDDFVLWVVREAVRRAELDADITPRTLRHSYATHLMESGVDLSVIASLMGHRSPKETGVYLHALPGRKEAAVTRLENPAIDTTFDTTKEKST